MNKITLIAMVFGIQFSFAQNTFPATGNVGIGTTNPITKLDVSGNLMLRNYSNSVGGGNQIHFTSYDTASPGPIIKSNLEFASGVDSKMSLTLSSYWGAYQNELTLRAGNVGIGTTTPTTKLEVNGNTIITAGFGGWAEGINIDSPNGIWGGLKFRTVGRNGANGNWHFGYDDVHSGATSTGNNIYLYNGSNSSYVMTYQENGNVGIATKNPDEKLTVKGKIHAEEVRIDLNVPAPDYVFANDYKLKSLQEVEDYIKQNSHLPEVPSAKEIEKNGLMLAEMNMALLKKVEELTLYVIEMKKENAEQNKKIEILQNKLINK